MWPRGDELAIIFMLCHIFIILSHKSPSLQARDHTCVTLELQEYIHELITPLNAIKAHAKCINETIMLLFFHSDAFSTLVSASFLRWIRSDHVMWVLRGSSQLSYLERNRKSHPVQSFNEALSRLLLLNSLK